MGLVAWVRGGMAFRLALANVSTRCYGWVTCSEGVLAAFWRWGWAALGFAEMLVQG
jgi:hypothetical protein